MSVACANFAGGLRKKVTRLAQDLRNTKETIQKKLLQKILLSKKLVGISNLAVKTLVIINLINDKNKKYYK